MYQCQPLYRSRSTILQKSTVIRTNCHMENNVLVIHATRTSIENACTHKQKYTAVHNSTRFQTRADEMRCQGRQVKDSASKLYRTKHVPNCICIITIFPLFISSLLYMDPLLFSFSPALKLVVRQGRMVVTFWRWMSSCSTASKVT